MPRDVRKAVYFFLVFKTRFRFEPLAQNSVQNNCLSVRSDFCTFVFSLRNCKKRICFSETTGGLLLFPIICSALGSDLYKKLLGSRTYCNVL